MPNMIDEAESTSIPGRLISNNVVVAFEVIHFMKSKSVGKHGDSKVCPLETIHKPKVICNYA